MHIMSWFVGFLITLFFIMITSIISAIVLYDLDSDLNKLLAYRIYDIDPSKNVTYHTRESNCANIFYAKQYEKILLDYLEFWIINIADMYLSKDLQIRDAKYIPLTCYITISPCDVFIDDILYHDSESNIQHVPKRLQKKISKYIESSYDYLLDNTFFQEFFSKGQIEFAVDICFAEENWFIYHIFSK